MQREGKSQALYIDFTKETPRVASTGLPEESNRATFKSGEKKRIKLFSANCAQSLSRTAVYR